MKFKDKIKNIHDYIINNTEYDTLKTEINDLERFNVSIKILLILLQNLNKNLETILEVYLFLFFHIHQ